MAAELGKIDAMLGRLARPDEYHWDVKAVALLQVSIFVDIHLTKRGAKLTQQWRDRCLRFFT